MPSCSSRAASSRATCVAIQDRGRSSPCTAARASRRRRASGRHRPPVALPPTPMIGCSGPTSVRSLASTTVERSKSGRPESPPDSSRAAAASSGRPMVVFETTSPSMPRASTMRAMSAICSSSRIRCHLQEHRHLPAVRGRRCISCLAHAGEQVVERLGRLEIAQARRVRRAHVHREVRRDGGERLDAGDVVGEPVMGILLAPTFTPTIPGRPARRPSRARAASWPRC